MPQRYAADADFTLRIPASSTIDVAERQAALDDAEPFIELVVFAEKAMVAHVYLAAHFLACRRPEVLGGETGGLTSRKLGEISAGYAPSTVAGDVSSWGTTPYGRKYLQICSTVAHEPIATV